MHICSNSKVKIKQIIGHVKTQIVLGRFMWVLKYESSTMSKCCRSVYYNKKTWPPDTEPVQLVFFSVLIFPISFLCK